VSVSVIFVNTTTTYNPELEVRDYVGVAMFGTWLVRDSACLVFQSHKLAFYDQPSASLCKCGRIFTSTASGATLATRGSCANPLCGLGAGTRTTSVRTLLPPRARPKCISDVMRATVGRRDIAVVGYFRDLHTCV